MPTTRPRLTEVAYETRGGDPSGRGEDRVFTTANAVVVLDGATQPDATTHDGGWLAETLGHEIRNRLSAEPSGDLASVLALSIGAVRDRHGLRAGAAPSTTVSVARWTGECVDALVLGDSPIIAIGTDGGVTELRDDRLAQIARPERRELHNAGDQDERRRSRTVLTQIERGARNRAGGYWIAETEPAAAAQAVQARWSRETLRALLVATDGVSIGVDSYGTPSGWLDALALAERDPALLIDTVQEVEERDPQCVRWPRSKRHDDKAVAIVRFQR